MTGGAVLEARNLYRFYRAGGEETLALRGVSLSVERGETLAVIGPSGSGKSTLLACLAGLEEPDGGVVTVAGDRLSHRPEPERARIRAQRIGVLMQSQNLLPHLNLRANVRLAQLASSQRNPRRPIQGILDEVGLDTRATAMPGALSGGELARAGLAVAVANDPDVLLADEPTGELDGQTERRVLALLRERAAEGCGIVLVTHNSAVRQFADRVVSLLDGVVAP